MNANGISVTCELVVKQRVVLCLVAVILLLLFALNSVCVQPARACYGPCITANISRTQININETVTVTGQICPPAPNTTIRVAFTRPDYTFIEQYVLTDSETGEFTVTQRLDTAGFWNIFPIYGFICDRL